MRNYVSAPGSTISRREFLAATGSVGALGLAGCAAPTNDDGNAAVGTDETTVAQTSESSLPYTSPSEVVQVDEQGRQVTLKSAPACHAAHPLGTMGGPVELPQVWAFNADDGESSVPGPILRTTEGNDMEVTLDNTDGTRSHTVRFHGVHKARKDDGAPTTTGTRVDPGEKHTYIIPTSVPGTHLYHCHYQTHRHIEMGMYGILRVDPKGYEPADREYFMTVRDWDSWLPRQMTGENVTYSLRDRKPDVFTVNEKSVPQTLHPEDGSPIIVEQGGTARVHYVNAGYMSHPMHIHNHRFQVIEKDGGVVLEAARHDMDVTNTAPAERHTIEFTADAQPGIYFIHCHKVNHVMNGGFYPGGMLSGVVYKEAMDTDILASPMEYVGYEG